MAAQQSERKKPKNRSDFETWVEEILLITGKKEFTSEAKEFLKQIPWVHYFTDGTKAARLKRKFEPLLTKLFIEASVREDDAVSQQLLKLTYLFSPGYELVFKDKPLETQRAVAKTLVKFEAIHSESTPPSPDHNGGNDAKTKSGPVYNINHVNYICDKYPNLRAVYRYFVETPLSKAVKDDDIPLVKALLEYKKLFNTTKPPLSTGMVLSPLRQAVTKDYPAKSSELIKLLAEAGEQLESKSNTTSLRQMTALEIAACMYNPLAVKELIRQGALLPEVIEFFYGYHKGYEKEIYEVFSNLLEAGLNPNTVVLPRGENALAYAICHKNYALAKLLFEAGAGAKGIYSVRAEFQILKEESKKGEILCWDLNSKGEEVYVPFQDLENLLCDEQGKLLLHSKSYLNSLLKYNSQTLLLALLDILPLHFPKTLSTLIATYAVTSLPDTNEDLGFDKITLKNAKNNQHKILNKLKSSAINLTLPQHFKSLLNTLERDYIMSEAKITALIVKSITNYAATWTEERLEKIPENPPELPLNKFKETDFFTNLQHIVGEQAINEALRRGIKISQTKGLPEEDGQEEKEEHNASVTQREEKVRDTPSTPPSSIFAPLQQSSDALPLDEDDERDKQQAIMLVTQAEDIERERKALDNIIIAFKNKYSQFYVEAGIADLDRVKERSDLYAWLQKYLNADQYEPLKKFFLDIASAQPEGSPAERVFAKCWTILNGLSPVVKFVDENKSNVPPLSAKVDLPELPSLKTIWPEKEVIKEKKLSYHPAKMDPRLIKILSVPEGKRQLEALRESKQLGAFLQQHPHEPNTLSLVIHDPTRSETYKKWRNFQYNISFVSNEKGEGDWLMWVPVKNSEPIQSYPLKEFRKNPESEEALNSLQPFVMTKLSAIKHSIGLPEYVTLKLCDQENSFFATSASRRDKNHCQLR